MLIWNPILGEFLMARLEVENEFGKFAVVVKKCDVVVEHLSKASQIRKSYFIFSSWKQ